MRMIWKEEAETCIKVLHKNYFGITEENHETPRLG
jgi:hypothetical protein